MTSKNDAPATPTTSTTLSNPMSQARASAIQSAEARGHGGVVSKDSYLEYGVRFELAFEQKVDVVSHSTLARSVPETRP